MLLLGVRQIVERDLTDIEREIGDDLARADHAPHGQIRNGRERMGSQFERGRGRSPGRQRTLRASIVKRLRAQRCVRSMATCRNAFRCPKAVRMPAC